MKETELRELKEAEILGKSTLRRIELHLKVNRKKRILRSILLAILSIVASSTLYLQPSITNSIESEILSVTLKISVPILSAILGYIFGLYSQNPEDIKQREVFHELKRRVDEIKRIREGVEK